MGLEGLVPAGVVTGDNLMKLMTYCKENGHALPAFNCTSTSTINAVLQAARDINSPVIIQVRDYCLFFEQLLTVVLYSCCPCCVGNEGGGDVGCWRQVMCCCSVLQWRGCLPGWQGDQEHGGEGRGARRYRRGAARPAHGQALRGARGAAQRPLRQGNLVR